MVACIGMPSRRPYVTDAIVLSRFELGEADRVLTLLTPEYGKIRVIARGIRRQTSRLRWNMLLST